MPEHFTEEILSFLRKNQPRLTKRVKQLNQELLTAQKELDTCERLIGEFKAITGDPEQTPKPTTQKRTRKRYKIEGPFLKAEQVRDWFVDQKGPFTAKDIAAHFKRSRAWGDLQAKKFVGLGIIQPINLPTKRGEAIIYGYEKPIHSGLPKLHGSHETIRVKGSRAVAGTGKSKIVSMDKDLNHLLNRARQQGAIIERSGSGHIKVIVGDKSTTVSSTPGDRRSLDNSRSELAKLGIAV